MNEEKDTRTSIDADLGGGVTMKFLPIPGGSLRMGQRGEYADEEPVTEVAVAAFWMGETPVTQAQYRVMVRECADQLGKIERNKGAEPSEFKGDSRPVEHVSWDEALVVAKWLTLKLIELGKLPEGYRVDLPSEVEWEHACRAGSETVYWSGDGKAAMAQVGWYDENSESRTHDVKEKCQPNPWGLHDMHGNVWEWCRDRGDERANRLRVPGEESRDVVGSDGDRVLRGGSWGITARYCRSAIRRRNWPGGRIRFLGFRLAVVPGPSSQAEAGGRENGAEPAAGGKPRRDDESVPQAGGGADLNTNFPPRSGDDFSNSE